MPSACDTIVAVSTGWQPSPLAIMRLSGPDSFALAERVGVARPVPTADDGPVWTAGRLETVDQLTLPVTAFWFRGPRSYTGQDVVELHTVGCLPLLRELAARLIELGARRALPGELTARAFLNGRLTTQQVEGVLALMRSEDEAALRQAARLARGSERRAVADIAQRIVGLLARIEAGIDFPDEEGVRFVTPHDVIETLDALLNDLGSAGRPGIADPRLGRPHIALAGLPNAGKSTLFNRLIGCERALVSPVLGTTRDVLSADVAFGGLAVILQDCAGAGGSTDELERACHLAGERAAQDADLVLWVHAVDMTWDERETVACAGIAPERRWLVWSKADLIGRRSTRAAPVAFAGATEVSAANGSGIPQLRAVLGDRLSKLAALRIEALCGGEVRAAAAALSRARAVAAGSDVVLSFPELISLELRAAEGLLEDKTPGAIDERLLERIFAEFCVGK